MPQLTLTHHATCNVNVVARHNSVRDMTAQHAYKAYGTSIVHVEPTGLDPHTQARPADVLLLPPTKLCELRAVAFDVTIVSNATSLADARRAKHAHYNAQVLATNNITFIPLVFHPLGHTDPITRDALLKSTLAPPGPGGVMHDITIIILNALADMYNNRHPIPFFLRHAAETAGEDAFGGPPPPQSQPPAAFAA